MKKILLFVGMLALLSIMAYAAPCTPSWSCDSWGASCDEGKLSRDCSDLNSCDSTNSTTNETAPSQKDCQVTATKVKSRGGGGAIGVSGNCQYSYNLFLLKGANYLVYYIDSNNQIHYAPFVVQETKPDVILNGKFLVQYKDTIIPFGEHSGVQLKLLWNYFGGIQVQAKNLC